jgi:hypothetical protein
MHASLLQILLPLCGLVLHNLALCAVVVAVHSTSSVSYSSHLQTSSTLLCLILYWRRVDGALHKVSPYLIGLQNTDNAGTETHGLESVPFNTKTTRV